MNSAPPRAFNSIFVVQEFKRKVLWCHASLPIAVSIFSRSLSGASLSSSHHCINLPLYNLYATSTDQLLALKLSSCVDMCTNLRINLQEKYIMLCLLTYNGRVPFIEKVSLINTNVRLPVAWLIYQPLDVLTSKSRLVFWRLRRLYICTRMYVDRRTLTMVAHLLYICLQRAVLSMLTFAYYKDSTIWSYLATFRLL